MYLILRDDTIIIANTANNNKNGTYLLNSNTNKVINNVLLGNSEYCYNQTGSLNNIFEGNVCTSIGCSLVIDLSLIFLILVIIESLTLAVIFSTYFVIKRKS